MNYDYRHLDLSTFHPGLSASLMTAVNDDREDIADEDDDRFASVEADGEEDVSRHITPAVVAQMEAHFGVKLAPCAGKWGDVKDYGGAYSHGTRVYFRLRDACPCCGEVFSFTPDADGDDGAIECGGEGMGSCAGILAALSEDPEAEWDSLDTDEPYPGDEVMSVYRARYDAFVATLK